MQWFPSQVTCLLGEVPRVLMATSMHFLLSISASVVLVCTTSTPWTDAADTKNHTMESTKDPTLWTYVKTSVSWAHHRNQSTMHKTVMLSSGNQKFQKQNVEKWGSKSFTLSHLIPSEIEHLKFLPATASGVPHLRQHLLVRNTSCTAFAAAMALTLSQPSNAELRSA